MFIDYLILFRDILKYILYYYIILTKKLSPN